MGWFKGLPQQVKDAKILVEAPDQLRHHLWQITHSFMEWEKDGSGYMKTLAMCRLTKVFSKHSKLKEEVAAEKTLPLTIVVWPTRLDGVDVIFYGSDARCVDWTAVIEDYLARKWPNARKLDGHWIPLVGAVAQINGRGDEYDEIVRKIVDGHRGPERPGIKRVKK